MLYHFFFAVTGPDTVKQITTLSQVLSQLQVVTSLINLLFRRYLPENDVLIIPYSLWNSRFANMDFLTLENDEKNYQKFPLARYAPAVAICWSVRYFVYDKLFSTHSPQGLLVKVVGVSIRPTSLRLEKRRSKKGNKREAWKGRATILPLTYHKQISQRLTQRSPWYLW